MSRKVTLTGRNLFIPETYLFPEYLTIMSPRRLHNFDGNISNSNEKFKQNDKGFISAQYWEQIMSS